MDATARILLAEGDARTQFAGAQIKLIGLEQEAERKIGPPWDDQPTEVDGVTKGSKKKELDEVKGIPKWPTVAGYAGSRRGVRYAVYAASSTPKSALKWLSKTKGWRGDVADVPAEAAWETLGAKLGRALRAHEGRVPARDCHIGGEGIQKASQSCRRPHALCDD